MNTAGNRDWFKLGTDPNTPYVPNALNLYASINDPNDPNTPAESFTYDDDQNLSEVGGIGVSPVGYAYDAENRLVRVEPAEDDPNELTAEDKKLEFKYDYMGRRVEKAVYAWDPNTSDWESDPDPRRRFVWSDWLLVLELDATDPNDVTVLRKYTWGLDVAAGASPGRIDGAGGTLDPIASRQGQVGGLLAAYDTNGTPGTTADDKSYLYFHDANGNIGQLIDRSDGSIAAKYEYDAYGNNLLDPNDPNESGPYAANNPFRFSTKYWDDGTGLGYWGYRYYSPRVGRWLNRDPIGEVASRSLYRGFRNSPYVYYDYLGREDEPVSGSDEPDQPGGSAPPTGPTTQPAIDKSKACCLYSQEWTYRGGDEEPVTLHCYKEEKCPKDAQSPEQCCCGECSSTTHKKTLVGADWGECCFCTVKVASFESSGFFSTPHRSFSISCPSWNGHNGFSRTYSFAGKKKIVGAGQVVPRPDPAEEIGYTWTKRWARIPCREGHALKDAMDARYPKDYTREGVYVWPFYTCWDWSSYWFRKAAVWSECGR